MISEKPLANHWFYGYCVDNNVIPLSVRKHSGSWKQYTVALACAVTVLVYSFHTFYWFLKGKLKGATSLLELFFAVLHSHYMYLFLCHLHSLSSCVSPSLKAIHITHNNPYNHLFLFMSLHFTHRCSSHANVNSGTDPPWGSFPQHTYEQSTNACLQVLLLSEHLTSA